MLLGCCTSAIAQAKTIASSGLDYVEENVQVFLAPEGSDADFAARTQQGSLCARSIQAACCFLPGGLKCVGPEVDDARLDRYARSAFARAQKVGIDTIVFGSGGARGIPEGWTSDKAFTQFVAVLKRFAPIAVAHGVTLVVEPLNRGECNFVNTIDEGAEVVRAVDRSDWFRPHERCC